MYVLGLSGGYGHDPAAALVRDSEVLAAVEEERFTRRKHAFGQVPVHAAAYCLAAAGITMSDVDAIALAWQPEHPPPWPTRLHEDLLAHPFFAGARRPPIEVVPHPVAHATAALRYCGFDEAAVLIVDGQGDGISTTLAHGTSGGIDVLDQYEIEDSLGFFYWALTTYLGWDWGEEGKVMGLAPYGLRNGAPAAFDLRPDGYDTRITVEPSDGHWRRGRATFAAWRHLLEDQFGPAVDVRYTIDPLTQRPRRSIAPTDRERAVAAWGQQQLEDVMCHLARVVVRQTGCRKLVVGGGSAYNCSVNGLLRALPEIDDVFVFPASGDAGTSLGAALAVAGAHAGPPGAPPLDHADFGPGFDDDDIATLLRDSGVPSHRSPDVAAEAAGLLAAGRVIGWFQGRTELGPRALGNRSILATPSSAGVRDRVNAIKGRETWRPLAPSLLAESTPTYLADPRPAPFMLTATAVREEVREQVPGIVHVDGSCRPQTVQRGSGTRYAELLARLDELTGIPVVLNTSFNIGEEPIVLSPRDAVRSFAVSGLDALVIGDSVVVKERAAPPRA